LKKIDETHGNDSISELHFNEPETFLDAAPVSVLSAALKLNTVFSKDITDATI
jgi:hypothetical protein